MSDNYFKRKIKKISFVLLISMIVTITTGYLHINSQKDKEVTELPPIVNTPDISEEIPENIYPDIITTHSDFDISNVNKNNGTSGKPGVLYTDKTYIAYVRQNTTNDELLYKTNDESSEFKRVFTANNIHSVNRYGEWFIFVSSSEGEQDEIIAYNFQKNIKSKYFRNHEFNENSKITSMFVKNDKIYYMNNKDETVYSIKVNNASQGFTPINKNQSASVYLNRILHLDQKHLITEDGYSIYNTSLSSKESHSVINFGIEENIYTKYIPENNSYISIVNNGFSRSAIVTEEDNSYVLHQSLGIMDVDWVDGYYLVMLENMIMVMKDGAFAHQIELNQNKNNKFFVISDDKKQIIIYNSEEPYVLPIEFLEEGF